MEKNQFTNPDKEIIRWKVIGKFSIATNAGSTK